VRHAVRMDAIAASFGLMPRRITVCKFERWARSA
jgi:hypothetical protein